MWHHPNQTCNTSFPQFSAANQRPSSFQIRCVIWTSIKNNCCSNTGFYHPSFLYTKKCPFRIQILALVCPQHHVLTTPLLGDSLSFRVLQSTWSYSQIQGVPFLQFPHPIPQSNTALAPVCHSTPPPSCPETACLKSELTNALHFLHLRVLWYPQAMVLDLNGEGFCFTQDSESLFQSLWQGMETLWRLIHWLQGWRVCFSSCGARWLISNSA